MLRLNPVNYTWWSYSRSLVTVLYCRNTNIISQCLFKCIVKTSVKFLILVFKSVNFDVGILCSSKNVKAALHFSPSIAQHMGCHTRLSICDPHIECFNIFYWCCKHSVVYVPPKEKKSREVMSGERGDLWCL